jgi:NAD(P)-dependent dehydrogenase (short-subunit alcohol dehydrogenase family)
VQSNRLQNKVAVVTGFGSGIGQGCALMFARHGAKVLGADIDAGAAERAVAAAEREGLAVQSLHPCDVTEPKDVERLMDAAAERFGGIDILVNSAAFGAFAWIQDMDYQQQWKKTLVGELDVVFLACKAVWPHFLKRGAGSIINFASANAHMALPGSPALAHCAGKGGVLAMTRQLAMEGGAAPDSRQHHLAGAGRDVRHPTGARQRPRLQGNGDGEAHAQTSRTAGGHRLVCDLSRLG